MNELEIRARNHLRDFVLKVISDSSQNYDYTNWNISWKTTPATTNSILEIIFGLNDEQEIIYCRKNYNDIIQDFINDIQHDEILIKKFFRFYMCLPVFEYEYISEYYDNLADLPPYNGSETTNSFMRSICNFKYQGRFKKITDRRLNLSMNKALNLGLLRKKYLRELIVKIKDPDKVPRPEINYIYNAREKVLLPLLPIIDEILGKPFRLEAERLKSDTKSVSNVDLGVYDKNESLNRMYCSIEFKQFPICPKNYGPNGTIDLNQLFSTESTDPRKNPPINKFLKQLLCEMMSHKTNRGILTDSYTYIFIEIDLKRFNNDLKSTMSEHPAPKTTREIPLNYIIKNNHSPNVTLRQTLLEFLSDSIIDNESFEIMEKQIESFLKYYRLSYNEFSRLESERTSNRQTSGRNMVNRASYYGSSSYRQHSYGLVNDECHEEINSIDSDSIFSSISSRNSNEIEELDSNNNDKNGKNDKNNKNSFHIDSNRRIKYKNNSMSILVPRNDIDVLKHGDNYYSQVYVVDSKYFLDYLSHPTLTKDKVVIKIHDSLHFPSDYFRYNEFYSDFTRQQIRDEKKNICYDNYCFEKKCYETLSNNPKFNSIGYNQKDLYLIFCCEDEFNRVGWTNIFKYIETQPMPRNIETYKKAVEQLEIIHENGIIHNDISNRNILYSKDGKVYIIDFAGSYFNSDTDRIEDEKSILRGLFFEDEPETITELE